MEHLESRVLLSAGDSLATALGVTFLDTSLFLQTAHLTQELIAPRQVILNRLQLSAGEVVVASIDTSSYGSGLDSFLRVFKEDDAGRVRQIASNDNYRGNDPRLTFQADVSGNYYVGISSFDNTQYDPSSAGATAGSSHGLFDLTLAKSTAATAPDLWVSSVQVGQSSAVWGDSVTVNFTLQNRGALPAASGPASLLMSANNRFDDGLPALLTVELPALASGKEFTGSLTCALGTPGSPLPTFLDSQRIFLGLQIGTTPASSPREGNDWIALEMLKSESIAAGTVHDSLATALPIELNSRTSDALLPGGHADFYRVALRQAGNLSASVNAGGGAFSLTLYDSRGVPVVRSDGRSADDQDPWLTHGLLGSDEGKGYYLKVTNRSATANSYTLTTQFASSVSVLQDVPIGAGDAVLVRGDFNGDGKLDLATGNLQDGSAYPANNVAVLLGNGDGTFQRAANVPLGTPPEALLAADLNGDGRLDLVASSSGSDGLRICPGNGDGTFQSAQIITGPSGIGLAAGDFDGDGRLDLVVSDHAERTVGVLLNDSAGAFHRSSVVTVDGAPIAIVAGDFNADGRWDAAVATQGPDQVTMLLGLGDGAFTNVGAVAAGEGPASLAAADFDRDGYLDVAVANIRSNDVTVLLGDELGSLRRAGTYRVGSLPQSIVTGDFDGDGRVDLATANSSSNDVTILRGQAGGAFQNAGAVDLGANTLALVAGDIDGDGAVDLAGAAYFARSVKVLLGHGDGTFPEIDSTITTGQQPIALVPGDFNGDGRIDLAAANSYSGDVTVRLGQGDGTFATTGNFAVGRTPVALAAADFNGDGRLDVVVANQASNDVSLLLGNGDGTFQDAAAFALEGKPSALTVGDFDEDHRPDLAIALKFSADYATIGVVKILLGDGRGGFQDGDSLTTGLAPAGLVTGDFDGDGHLDLASADSYYYARSVTVLLGNGHGGFGTPTSYEVGSSAIALVAGDFNGDAHTDLAVATTFAESVTLLLNDGQGVFANAGAYGLDTRISSLVEGDFDGDGYLDLAAAHVLFTYDYARANFVTVMLGDGLGGFATRGPFPTGSIPFAVAAADFNGDRRLDLATANLGSADLTALLGTGAGDFLPSVLVPNPVQATPLLANLTSKKVADAVVLTETGKILFRRALENQPGAFAPPLVLNPSPEQAARDLALVQSGSGELLLAALSAGTFEAAQDPTLARSPRVTLYQPHADGDFTSETTLNLPAGFLPADIAAADLDGHGLDDLVISAAASDQVFVSLQTTSGVFAPAVAFAVGVNPSSLELVDLNKDDRRDIIVANRFSGQVSVLVNLGNGQFQPEDRYRAGTGLYNLAEVNGAPAVRSLAGTTDLVAGDFDGAGGTDLVVINSRSDTMSLLSGNAEGGFLNPQPGHTARTFSSPVAIVAGKLSPRAPNVHLAVLSKDTGTISLYRTDAAGTFTLLSTVDAGNQPTGLALGDVSRPGGGGPDGRLDLLVGNALGDLLILTGAADGSFAPYRRADQTVSLAAASSADTGMTTFYFSNQGSDQLAFKTVASGTRKVAAPTVFENRSGGIQSPGPQAVVTVGTTQYLVVANSGGNQVVIYPIGSDGQPDLAGKQTYFTGTNPISLTVTDITNDLNGDSIPDLVVTNEGSNDVSVFLGELTDTAWTLAYRPRQSSAGIGPTSAVIADITGADGSAAPDGIPDLLVSNGHSNDVKVLSSRGDGFFVSPTDSTPLSFPTGTSPRNLLLGNFDGIAGPDLVTVNTGSSDVTLIANFLTTPSVATFSSGGIVPVSAVVLDANNNGISDLLIANAGSRTVDLLLGGPAGFEFSTSQDTTLPHLTDLTLVATGNELALYGSDAGREIAVLLGTFGLREPAPSPPTFLPPSPGFPAGLELASDLKLAQDLGTNLPAAFVLIARRANTDSVRAEEFLAEVVPARDPDNANIPVTEHEDPEEGQAPRPVEATPRDRGGILLLNLTEPAENDGNRREPNQPEQEEKDLPDHQEESGETDTAPLESAPPPASLSTVTPGARQEIFCGAFSSGGVAVEVAQVSAIGGHNLEAAMLFLGLRNVAPIWSKTPLRSKKGNARFFRSYFCGAMFWAHYQSGFA